jgi:hypothetical protein
MQLHSLSKILLLLVIVHRSHGQFPQVKDRHSLTEEDYLRQQPSLLRGSSNLPLSRSNLLVRQRNSFGQHQQRTRREKEDEDDDDQDDEIDQPETDELSSDFPTGMPSVVDSPMNESPGDQPSSSPRAIPLEPFSLKVQNSDEWDVDLATESLEKYLFTNLVVENGVESVTLDLVDVVVDSVNGVATSLTSTEPNTRRALQSQNVTRSLTTLEYQGTVTVMESETTVAPADNKESLWSQQSRLLQDNADVVSTVVNQNQGNPAILVGVAVGVDGSSSAASNADANDEGPRTGLAVGLTFLFLAIAVGGLVYWKRRHRQLGEPEAPKEMAASSDDSDSSPTGDKDGLHSGNRSSAVTTTARETDHDSDDDDVDWVAGKKPLYNMLSIVRPSVSTDARRAVHTNPWLSPSSSDDLRPDTLEYCASDDSSLYTSNTTSPQGGASDDGWELALGQGQF